MISIDCSVLRTLTIYPHHSHIAGLKSRFYAHVGAGSKVIHPLMSELMWSYDFGTLISSVYHRFPGRNSRENKLWDCFFLHVSL